SSVVLYGLTPALGDTMRGKGAGVLQHEVNLTGLTPSTNYRFKVMSADNSGNVSTSGTNLFKTTSPPVASTTLSDDFRDSLLNQVVWTFVNPVPPGDAALTITGETARITVPSGSSHDLWTNGYQSPRIMQPANDTDVDITVKFNSGLVGSAGAFQSQGLVFEADSQNVIRFDFTTGFNDSTKIFAAVLRNGFTSPVVKVSENIAPYNQAPLFLRVRRESNVWTELYSFDGVLWTVATTFYHAFPLGKVGVFAANAGSSPPQFVSLIDEIRGARPSVPHLISPANGVSNVVMPVSLFWDQALQATGYHVQVAADSLFSGLVRNDSTVLSLNYQVDGLQGSTKYYWRVRGRSPSGTGLFSAGRSFTTAPVIPAAPVLLLPPDGAGGQPVEPVLTWSVVPSATGYHLQLATDSLFSAVVLHDSTLVDTTTTISGLAYLSTYHWRVRGQNSAGIGPYSTSRKFTTVIAPPGPVTLFTPPNHATALPILNLVFTWSDPGSVTRYRFLLATDSTFAAGIIKDDSTVVDTFRVVSGLATNTRFYWSVIPLNEGGAGPQSVVWDFTTGSVLGVDHPDPIPETFALYQNFPNPFNPSTEIMYDVAQPVTVTLSVHDLLGRSIRSLVSGPQYAGRYLVRWAGDDDKGSRVASGVYLYRLQAGSFVQTRRLVLLR
ncbi:MAG: T9SS type A sorting domain-containing protein, partial [Ignavibacteria bacterium]|nr:T9SS type A sorting domain-containing protein [Ignavibacteria bacterium]